ncbi:GntR family transcriptional regulator [Acidiferrimicrobium sp. IK]|uniref:GntR family transcriptional regulator n=1 Tax=Acidiferrimicrobium sp. IK TaxID=2871700 RepID=UPI0021CB7BCA|nr:GntR family transcriptional regulator [Acidiferrimicrobium sp. IK]MCU4185899.1 GntR family transcriptional regulator [Acidiferrimicrobium sp. IK]
MLDRLSPLPLWAQIADDLRRRLVGGEFEDHFPTDEELTRDYGVSRQTVREAVRRLTQEGLVTRQRGRGSSVTQPILEQPLHSLYSLASTVRAGGIEERSEVLAAERRPATLEAAEQLRVDPGAEVVFIERLRFAGPQPIAWDRSWLSNDHAGALLGADLSSGGLYDLLAACCALRITGGWERIRPVVPSAVERELLRLPAQEAAFSIERLAAAGELPVEWRRSLIRGDRYSLIAQWPSGASPRSDRPS